MFGKFRACRAAASAYTRPEPKAANHAGKSGLKACRLSVFIPAGVPALRSPTQSTRKM